MEEVLGDQGHTLSLFLDTEEALRRHRKDPFPFVVVDTVLGGSDCLEVCRTVRRTPLGEDAFIMAVTSEQRPAELMAVVDGVVDDFLQYPCDATEAEARFLLAERRLERRRNRRLAIKGPLDEVDLGELLFRNVEAGCVLLQSILGADGAIKDFTVVDVNPAFESLAQINKPLLTDKPISEVFPAVGPQWIEKAAKAAQGEPLRFDLQFPRTSKHFKVSCFGAKPGFVIATCIETTDYHRAREALSHSEKRLRHTLDALPDIVYELTLDGTIVYANQSASDHLDIPLDEVGRLTLDDLLPREDREKALSLMADMMVTGHTRTRSRYNLLKPDGSLVPVEAHAILIERENGRPSVLGIARDITERLKREDERKRLDSQIQKTQRLQSLRVLAGGLAHDFNNLLVVVLGNAAMAKNDLPDVSPLRKHLERVEAAARRAAGLTEQMLAYAGQGQTANEAVDLSVTVEEMSKLLGVSLTRGQEIVWESDGTQPQIQGDPGQIRQLLMNLVTNAAEASESRDAKITIKTGTTELQRKELATTYVDDGLPAGSYAYLEIRDKGCGMDEATKARMFEPFFTTKFTGRGLGLAASLGILRSHGGAVRVDSAPGEGTRITVYLPSIQPGYALPAMEGHAGRIQKSSGGGTVLVVEDQQPVLDIAKEILQSAGYQVLTAMNGREGLEVLKQKDHSISVVLLDLLMPHMDGEETLQRMLELRPDLPIVVSSGYSHKEAAHRFAVEGLADYIKKPYDPATLLSKIDGVANQNMNRRG